MSKKRKKYHETCNCICTDIWNRSQCLMQCIIMEGYLPVGYCIAWGGSLCAVSHCGLLFHSEDAPGEQEGDHSSCHVRSICVCHFLIKDSVCDW